MYRMSRPPLQAPPLTNYIPGPEEHSHHPYLDFIPVRYFSSPDYVSRVRSLRDQEEESSRTLRRILSNICDGGDDVDDEDESSR
ncbi:hypothetical protein Tco_0860915 [Tanacetum coccineum]|uniref:Uncharacterized protein n=1 Tax=Tanacetum coccineum TaxID=301880 RepID=A0ABQ5BJB5_9ASTR